MGKNLASLILFVCLIQAPSFVLGKESVSPSWGRRVQCAVDKIGGRSVGILGVVVKFCQRRNRPCCCVCVYPPEEYPDPQRPTPADPPPKKAITRIEKNHGYLYDSW